MNFDPRVSCPLLLARIAVDHFTTIDIRIVAHYKSVVRSKPVKQRPNIKRHLIRPICMNPSRNEQSQLIEWLLICRTVGVDLANSRVVRLLSLSPDRSTEMKWLVSARLLRILCALGVIGGTVFFDRICSRPEVTDDCAVAAGMLADSELKIKGE